MDSHILIHNMNVMNQRIASMALENPEAAEGILELCEIFERACDVTRTHMRQLRASLLSFDEPIPTDEVEDFEASVLRTIAMLP